MLSLILACSSTTETGNPTTEFIPQLPVSTCHSSSYDFLPTTTMGEIVSTTEKDELSFTQAALLTILESYDLPLPDPRHDVETHYIQYRTQDKGQEVLATGMLSIPKNASAALPVLLWSHPTVGFNDSCAPTAQGLLGAAYPILFASLGFVVVSPDYLNLRGWIGESEALHPYIVAEPTAIVSIDALRALHNYMDTRSVDFSIDERQLILWGISEGGYASLAIDRYLPHYAPEFTSLATVATIPATDVFWLAQHGMNTMGPTTAGVLGSLTSMLHWYPTDLDLMDIVVPELASILERELLENCTDFDAILDLQTIEDIYLPEFIEGIRQDTPEAEPWSCFLKENSIPNNAVAATRVAPTFIVTAEEDDLAIAEPVHLDILKLCEEGYTIEHRQCEGADHVDGALDSLSEQWNWIQNRLDGRPLDNACVVQDPSPCIR